MDEDPEVTIYLNTLALPRALVLHNAVVVEDHDAAFVAVHDEDFDPQQVVVLEEGEPLDQQLDNRQSRSWRTSRTMLPSKSPRTALPISC